MTDCVYNNLITIHREIIDFDFVIWSEQTSIINSLVIGFVYSGAGMQAKREETDLTADTLNTWYSR